MPRPRDRLLVCPRRRPACALVLSAANTSPDPALPAFPVVRTQAATLALQPARRRAEYRSGHIFSAWDHRETFRYRQPQSHFRKSCRTGPHPARQRHGRAVRTARRLRRLSRELGELGQGASRIGLIENEPARLMVQCGRGGPQEHRHSSSTALRDYPSRERWRQCNCRTPDHSAPTLPGHCVWNFACGQRLYFSLVENLCIEYSRVCVRDGP
jgi:hypothetical protein